MIDETINSIFMNVGIDLHLINVSETRMADICDSLQYISLICDIEDIYKVEIPIEMISLPENKSIDDFLKELANIIDNKQDLI